MRYGSKTTAAAALLVAAVAGVGLALAVLRRDGDAEPVLVDERTGALHGVHFGDSERDARARLGEETDDRRGFFPAGANYTGPSAIPSPVSDRGSRIPPSELHYDDTACLVSPTGDVFSMASMKSGAHTRAGVGVGDDLSLVRKRYDRVECGEAIVGEPLFGGESPTYPWCRALVGDVRVHFGGDPIESITMTSYGR